MKKVQSTEYEVRSRTAGFTIVELLIATTVFSFILVLCSFAVLQIGRTYNKGIAQTRVQETARSITNQITEAIKFSGGTVNFDTTTPPAGEARVFCINNYRFTYALNRQVVSNDPNSAKSQQYHAMVVDKEPLSSCNLTTPPHALTDENIDDIQELVGERMRLANLSIAVDPGNNTMYKVTVKVVYGDNEILDGSGNCVGSRSGGQFCAVSELSTNVQRRITSAFPASDPGDGSGGGGDGGGSGPTVDCSPNAASYEVTKEVSFTIQGTAIGTPTWTAVGGNPSSGTVVDFKTTYSTVGVKPVHIDRQGASGDCEVNIVAKPK